jgi:hypothetical protein
MDDVRKDIATEQAEEKKKQQKNGQNRAKDDVDFAAIFEGKGEYNDKDMTDTEREGDNLEDEESYLAELERLDNEKRGF